VTFTERELAYLADHPLARLATVSPSGAPHNHPVAFVLTPGADAIDIGGPDLRRSRKYRNAAAEPRVSLVVDDNAPEPVGPGGQHGRGIEIRGIIEFLDAEPLLPGFTRDLMRVRPTRILAWNIDAPGRNSRDVPDQAA
jgi:pyridoxamine 5'-phosphate oxidase family protein